MKKIIALALALIMVLSMGVVALAAETAAPTTNEGAPYTITKGVVAITETIRPGDTIEIAGASWEADTLDAFKLVKVDFTTEELQGASLIDSVKFTKEGDAIRLVVKESYTMAEEAAKEVAGEITIMEKESKVKTVISITFAVNNEVKTIDGVRKASDAAIETLENKANTVTVVEEAGYVALDLGSELKGTAKVAKGDKVYLNANVDLATADPDQYDALVDAFGEDYEGIVEMYTFETKALADVAWTYDAWEEDPHYFYAWDGEKLTQIEAKYDADEDVDDYVFTADAAGTIVVCDEEVVLAAEETKNPDTGANDVVGVAAALAVVSLVAAGAVSLKK